MLLAVQGRHPHHPRHPMSSSGEQGMRRHCRTESPGGLRPPRQLATVALVFDAMGRCKQNPLCCTSHEGWTQGMVSHYRRLGWDCSSENEKKTQE